MIILIIFNFFFSNLHLIQIILYNTFQISPQHFKHIINKFTWLPLYTFNTVIYFHTNSKHIQHSPKLLHSCLHAHSKHIQYIPNTITSSHSCLHIHSKHSHNHIVDFIHSPSPNTFNTSIHSSNPSHSKVYFSATKSIYNQTCHIVATQPPSTLAFGKFNISALMEKTDHKNCHFNFSL